MSRSTILSALLVALASLAFAACADQDEVTQRLERAAAATKGLGMVVTTTGTASAGGISQPLRTRMTIAPGGRRARVSSEVAGFSLEQYLDDHFMLMGVDAFPGGGRSLPPGTRYLRFDLDELFKAMGIDATLRELQSLDPRRAAELMSTAEDVTSDEGRIGAAEVTRYSATFELEKMAETLAKGGDATRLKELFGDAEMQMSIAIDRDDRVRGFGMKGDMGPAKVDMQSVVDRYARDLEVTIPTKGVYDVTDQLTAALGKAP